VSIISTPRSRYKIIEIAGQKFNALVDTGSDYNIITQSSHGKIGAPKLADPDLLFSRFGGSKVVPAERGYFKDIIIIDGKQFQAMIYVVADDTMAMEAVVGDELLSQANVNINPDGVTINKIHEINSILSPSYRVELEAPAVGPIVCEEKRREVQDLLDNYTPKKIKGMLKQKPNSDKKAPSSTRN